MGFGSCFVRLSAQRLDGVDHLTVEVRRPVEDHMLLRSMIGGMLRAGAARLESLFDVGYFPMHDSPSVA